MRAADTVKGRARLGVQAFADALLVIPKVLAQNGGFDPQVLNCVSAYGRSDHDTFFSIPHCDEACDAGLEIARTRLKKSLAPRSLTHLTCIPLGLHHCWQPLTHSHPELPPIITGHDGCAAGGVP